MLQKSLLRPSEDERRIAALEQQVSPDPVPSHCCDPSGANINAELMEMKESKGIIATVTHLFLQPEFSFVSSKKKIKPKNQLLVLKVFFWLSYDVLCIYFYMLARKEITGSSSCRWSC